jgi:hypothetical protein
MFVKKPSVALKLILRSAIGDEDYTILPIYLFILRDETSGASLLLLSMEEIVTKLAQMETVALSLDPTLPAGASFPWLGLVRPIPSYFLRPDDFWTDYPGYNARGPPPHPKPHGRGPGRCLMPSLEAHATSIP